MNLEARPIVFEDMVRQILSCGYRKRPEELLQEIGRFKYKILGCASIKEPILILQFNLAKYFDI